MTKKQFRQNLERDFPEFIEQALAQRDELRNVKSQLVKAKASIKMLLRTERTASKRRFKKLAFEISRGQTKKDFFYVNIRSNFSHLGQAGPYATYKGATEARKRLRGSYRGLLS